MAESFTLLSVLEQAGGSHDQDDVDTDHAEHSREDVIYERVSERVQGRGAASHQSGGSGARAGLVGDESRGATVEIATAAEL